MKKDVKTKKGNLLEIEDLQIRLEEAKETLSAIRRGEVDGLVVSGPEGDQVFTLKGAERSYRFFVEAMNEGAVTLASDGTILYCNDRFAEMVATPYKRMIGNSIRRFISTPKEAFEPAFQKGKTERSKAEILFKGKNKKLIPVSVSFNPMQEDEVPGICMVVTDLTRQKQGENELRKAHDELEIRVQARTQELTEANKILESEIAERKRTEKALQESEHRFRTFAQASFEGIVLSEEGRILDCNEQFAAIVGYQRHELIGFPIRHLTAPEDQDPVMENILLGKDSIVEHGVVRKDGTAIIVEAHGKMLSGHGPSWRLTVVRDITEHKWAEEERRRFQVAIQEERDRLSALVNSITDEIWFADTQKKFTLANPSALREFGLEAVGNIDAEKLPATLEIYRPDGSLRPVDESPALRALQGEGINGQEEIVRTPSRGELRYRQVSSTPVRNLDGNIIGSVSVVRDITELKRMEGELRKSRDELELRVRERTEELAKSQERLQHLASQLLLAQEMERKRVAVDLHDGLMSELAATKFLLEGKVMLLDKGKPVTPGELRRIADLLGGAMREARRLMNNLHPSLLDELGLIATIGWLCTEYLKTYPHITVQKQISISEGDIARDLKIVIYRVLQESMNNFAKHGNGDRVDLSLIKPDGTLTLTIRDNGQGFNMQTVEKGLGLNSMRERIELSGGEFQIESIIGQGTTIRASWSI